MQKAVEHLPVFNGRKISCLCTTGIWYVAIRPICESLGIDFQAQHKRITSDEILSRVSSNQTMHDASKRLQKMFCLPEKFIYGWLFSVQSNSPELTEYKLRCYEILYEHFHGNLTGRLSALQQKSATRIRIEELKEKMLQSDEYREIPELETVEKRLNTQLKTLDKELIGTQLAFAFQLDHNAQPSFDKTIVAN